MTEQNQMNVPKFFTIPEVASTGIMSAASLRILDKFGLLPWFHVGRKVMVNMAQLCADLESPEYLAKVDSALQTARETR